MKSRKTVALGLAALLGVFPLAGCNGGGGGGGGAAAPAAVVEGDLADHDWSAAPHITIDVFSGLSNFMGTQPGWFAQIVRDKFNMDLNLISMNVGGGDTLYNTRVASGNIGDLVIISAGQRQNELVQGGLLLNAENFYPNMQYAREHDAAIEFRNADSGGVYVFPMEVSNIPPTEPSEGIDPTWGAFSRWDYYSELGYPTINTLEDLLPVLKDMQDAHPTAPNGQRVFGLSLFADWDGDAMNNALQPQSLYGFDQFGYTAPRADCSSIQDILDPSSEYIRTLHFYFEANQMGILDPESTTQNFDTLFSKYQNGQVLLGWWPWLAQSAFNTPEHTAAGQGYMILPIQDQTILSRGAPLYGTNQIVGIGARAQDPERIAAFIDWLYSPEGVQAATAGDSTMGGPGPLGMTWEMANGEPQLTPFGEEAIQGVQVDVPQEWGGGSFRDGVSQLGGNLVLPAATDPTTGFPFSPAQWPSVQRLVDTPLSQGWSSHMGGAQNTMDYLRSNNMLMVAPGASYVRPDDPSNIQVIRGQIQPVVRERSWQAIFAANEAEFNSIVDNMRSTADGLGYQDVLAFDMENAHHWCEANEAVLADFAH